MSGVAGEGIAAEAGSWMCARVHFAFGPVPWVMLRADDMTKGSV